MKIEIEFVTEAVPPVKPGHMELFIVAGVSKEGRKTCYPAYYLNAYPLEYQDDCEERGCPKDQNHDDGCPTTGWFYDESNFEYDNCYHPINGDVIAWATWPDRNVVHAALQTL